MSVTVTVKTVGAIAVLAVAAGCATQQPVLTPIIYEYSDVPAQRRVEVAYRNTTGVTMCLLPEHWPNKAGKINQASDSVFLIVGQARFPIENFNTGYCPQGCATRVVPGEKVSRSIPYADFGLPERLIDSPKTLEFLPVAFACEAK